MNHSSLALPPGQLAVVLTHQNSQAGEAELEPAAHNEGSSDTCFPTWSEAWTANLDQLPVLHTDARDSLSQLPHTCCLVLLCEQRHPAAITLHPTAVTGTLQPEMMPSTSLGLCDGPELSVAAHGTDTFKVLLHKRPCLC